MAKIHTVLFPVDFSRYYEEMLKYAYEFTMNIQGQLYVLYNIDTKQHLNHFFFLGYRNETEDSVYLKLYSRYNHRLNEITKTMPGVEITTVIEKGITYRNIVDAASKYKIDLIIIGSHGRESADYQELGSNARRVAAMAPCPVLLVKPKDFLDQYKKNTSEEILSVPSD